MVGHFTGKSIIARAGKAQEIKNRDEFYKKMIRNFIILNFID